MLYVNAYNGANFDHYFYLTAFRKLYGTPERMAMNNGAIIGFQNKNIKLIDLCKHMMGSLSSNLKSWKCNVQKGDFNHDLACRWEDMAPEMRADCQKYLEADVLGLEELYNKYNTAIFDKHRANVSQYISTSSLTFNLWKEMFGMTEDTIYLPTLEQEKAFRQAVRGGRTYKSKHRFTSKQLKRLNEDRMSFEEIMDYLVDADVVSLYPAAMSQYKYPVGKAIETDHIVPCKMGIYYVDVIPNKNLLHSIGGRRGDKGQLIWDLNNTRGYYTSVDIEDMLKRGYQVSIATGGKSYYWQESTYVFKEFIDEMFKAKASVEKGSPQYILAKLFMNALYGKMIQRPIAEKSKFIDTNDQYWKFWKEFDVKDIEQVGDSWYITGVPRDQKKLARTITKPTHMGAFILAYSRRIMLNYIDESNPHAKEMYSPEFMNKSEAEQQEIRTKAIQSDFFYTDTDSIQLHIKDKPKFNKDLGGITDDLGDGCKIVEGKWIAPKLYMLAYVKSDMYDRPLTKKDAAAEKKGALKVMPNGLKVHYHFRGKGLNTNTLSPETFSRMDAGESLVNTRPFSMKKINVSRNSKQQHIPHFSILHQEDVSRTVNKSAWGGRCFDGNASVPHGCIFSSAIIAA